MKDKKIALIFLLIGIFVVTLITVFCVMEKFEGKKLRRRVDQSYYLYVKTIPEVKLEFERVCEDDSCKEIVDDYELIDDNAKEIYKDIKFKDRDIFDVIVELCDVAYESDVIVVTEMVIESNYENLDEDDIEESIKDDSDNKLNIDVKVYIKESEKFSLFLN